MVPLKVILFINQAHVHIFNFSFFFLPDFIGIYNIHRLGTRKHLPTNRLEEISPNRGILNSNSTIISEGNRQHLLCVGHVGRKQNSAKR